LLFGLQRCPNGVQHTLSTQLYEQQSGELEQEPPIGLQHISLVQAIEVDPSEQHLLNSPQLAPILVQHLSV